MKLNKDKLLVIFFTIVYFICVTVVMDLIFRNTLSLITDILAIACYVIGFIASIGLAEYTVKKIKE